MLTGPEYAAHVEARWVLGAGTAKLKKRPFFVSKALAHEWVGFEEGGDGLWRLLFYDAELARLGERDFKLRAWATVSPTRPVRSVTHPTGPYIRR